MSDHDWIAYDWSERRRRIARRRLHAALELGGVLMVIMVATVLLA